MKPRILGYAVLLYAALTSIVVLDVVGFILKPETRSWWTLGDAVFWLALVWGGVGLIFGRAWSRLVVLGAAAASIVPSVVGLVLLSRLDIPLKAMSFGALRILPLVAIFVGALSLPAPAAWRLQPSTGVVRERMGSFRIDLAYGCFAWIALVLCAPLLGFLSQKLGVLSQNLADLQVLAMVVGIPIAMATMAVGLAAVVLSAMQWREWPLLAMSALSASILLMLFADIDEGSGLALAWYVGATAGLIFFCARWFAFARRREPQARGSKR